jgi:hypothetical protein
MHATPTSKAEAMAVRTGAPGWEVDKPREAKDVSFGDVLDVLNPLQHIPVVSTLYREATGDEISGMARVAGGALYGGPLGAMASGFDALISEDTGKDTGEHVVAALFGDGEGGEGQAPTTAVAANEAAGQGAGQATGEGDPAPRDIAAANGAASDDAPSGAMFGFGIDDAAVLGGDPRMGGQADAAAATTAGQGGTAQAGAASQAGDEVSRPAADGGAALQGREALAALASDLRQMGQQAATAASTQQPQQSAAQTSAQGGAQAAAQGAADRGRDGGDAARATQVASAPQGSVATGNDSDYQFMQLRPQDYNHSATLRSRMKAARSLLPDEAQHQQLRQNSPASAALMAQEARMTAERSAGTGNAGRDDNMAAGNAAASDPAGGTAPDFAGRMREALDKYRAMHQN